MPNAAPLPDPTHWALKLHEAAAELRMSEGPTSRMIKLASRLERYAEAILCPQLPRWWADQREAGVGAAAGGDD